MEKAVEQMLAEATGQGQRQPGKLDFAVHGGAVHISTPADLAGLQSTRVYEVDELIARAKLGTMDNLIKDLQAKVAPESWGAKGPGRAIEVNGLLVVRQTAKAQVAVWDYLGELWK